MAAVVFDAIGAGATFPNSSSTSFTNTATAGSYVVLGVIAQHEGTLPIYSAVTYGGVAMTLIASVALGNTVAHGRTDLYGLPNAPGGAQTVSVAVSNTAVFGAINTASYLNVSSVSAQQIAYNSISTLTMTTTGMVSGGMVVQSFGTQNGAMASFSGGTNRTLTGLLAMNDATADTTFTATQSGYGSFPYWGGLAVVLYPTPNTEKMPPVRIPNAFVGPQALRNKWRPRPASRTVLFPVTDVTGSATTTATGNLTADGVVGVSAGAPAAATGHLTADGVVTLAAATGSASITATGHLTADGHVTATRWLPIVLRS